MQAPGVSVIVAVYKDVEALGLILDSLRSQTYPPDEIIVTEDGEDPAMAEFMKRYPQVIHLTQEDRGWRKNRALNRAVARAAGPYLIFIDGDCVPFPTFVDAHMALRAEQTVLCGRRSEPGERFSRMLRQRAISPARFIKRYVVNYFALKRDRIRHYEQGIYLNPRGRLYRFLQRFKKNNAHIVGCNFSCYKADLVRINGFDEDFTMPTTGEDTDVERRLRHFGVKMKSCKNAANMFHLYHEKVFNPEIAAQTEALMASKSGEFVCRHGIETR